MTDLVEGTLADLSTFMSLPAGMRRGNTYVYKGQPNPAAGAGWTYTVPPEWWFRVKALRFTFTSAVAFATRQLALNYNDADSTTLLGIPIMPDLGASQVFQGQGVMGGVGAPPIGQSVAGEGKAAAPGAFATIASVTAPISAYYTVGWTVTLAGTLAVATDTDNMFLGGAGGANIQAACPALGGYYRQPDVNEFIASGSSVVVASSAAATAGSEYSASLVLTPATGGSTTIALPDLVLKSGYQLVLAGTNLQAADQLSAITMIAERYPSNWADGSLGSDQEEQARHLARLLAAGGWRM